MAVKMDGPVRSATCEGVHVSLKSFCPENRPSDGCCVLHGPILVALRRIEATSNSSDCAATGGTTAIVATTVQINTANRPSPYPPSTRANCEVVNRLQVSKN